MRPDFRGVRLKYLVPSGRWPSGHTRYYFRPRGRKGVPMPDALKDSPVFLRAYSDAMDAYQAGTEGLQGSIAETVTAYLKSDHYSTRAKSTREVWRRYLDHIKKTYGKAKILDLEARHIRQALAKFSAHEANNRLKAWRALCKFALNSGRIDRNPAAEVTKRETPKTDGHEPWTRADVAAFRKHWPIGTDQRLAFEVMHHTGCAIADALQLGDKNIRDGWIIHNRQKSTSPSACPFRGGPDWFEPTDMLHKCLAARNAKHLVWITTRRGAPRSAKAASQWFSAACRAAGVAKTAHGIRKHRAAIFRENGATPDQRMAILGHETTAQEAHYSKSADLRRIISGTKLHNPLHNSEKNTL